jgi:hypothetical protein
MKPLMCVTAVALALSAPAVTWAAEPDETAKVLEKYKPNTDKGLKWLADQQTKDGCWEAPNGQYRTAMTAFAGLALLGEGSTTKDGKYSEQLRKATAWMLARAQDNGRLGDVKDPGETGRYMMSHGYALLFLSQIYAKETDEKRHKEIGKVLEKAIDFTQKCQTKSGGWGYVSAADGGNFDEGCSTEIQLHGLFAARKAGIAVPKELVKSSLGYLQKSSKVVKDDKDATKKQAGMMYSLAQGGVGEPRPPLTIAAVALLLNAGETDNDFLIAWLNYVQKVIPVAKGQQNRFGHDEYIHFYFAQACFQLGEDSHAKMRPDLAEVEKEQKTANVLLRWSRYREVMFGHIASTQQENGSWKGTAVGDVYSTAVYLVILQLDKGHLPYYKR